MKKAHEEQIKQQTDEQYQRERRKKTSNKERKPVIKKGVTIGEVSAAIFAVGIPPQWRKGQFVFNRASMLYGDNFVRSLGHDPFYNDNFSIVIKAIKSICINKFIITY